MSAFLCNDQHINAMIRFGLTQNDTGPLAFRFGGHWKNYVTHESAQVLVDQNYRALKTRYGDNGKPHRINYSPFDPIYSPVEIIKACNCYNYQACETEDYKETQAAAIIKAIRELAIKNLPGYDNAQWEIVNSPLNQERAIASLQHQQI